MPIVNLFAVLPAIVIIVLLFGVVLLRRAQYPSPLVWGCILNKLGSVRAHHVLDYNEQIENEQPMGGRLGRESRRQQFKVNWGYLSAETKNTTLFLQALRFEKLKISASKPGMKYDPREVAVLELIEEITELRWEQIRSQFILRFRANLGLAVDNKMFLALLAHYKNLEQHMIVLAATEGNWLKEMLLERLGLMDWGVIQGGQADPQPA